jgi:phosphatidylinositol alpha-1,6-mannosyltransferase
MALNLGEGFGLVLIEAAAAGLAVVAGRAGGATEAVLDGETGLLVNPEDDGDVIQAIVRLPQDDGLRAQMADRGANFAADQFSFERFAGAVITALGPVVAGA